MSSDRDRLRNAIEQMFETGWSSAGIDYYGDYGIPQYDCSVDRHKWKNYVGLREVYDFCELCDCKRDTR